ncbi:ribosome biogenesis protein Noc1 [Schizosaccharomyces japonicus yFS275]|uniref:Ribosome biogenesis protein Noc1 n=1 Tax=Schizosaccharomyces japonicus (strain yFS275 / FY16936) TaxID=402676 RepID=B6K083_SCHJY|nr:ribosome biogenesis protein Noc1 [Schizosaccharomyces japonicus yFS275]EEB06233.1 ribosome biogenesis protein Noc1 [Schizosaccharomyces japonicus yFS275]
MATTVSAARTQKSTSSKKTKIVFDDDGTAVVKEVKNSSGPRLDPSIAWYNIPLPDLAPSKPPSAEKVKELFERGESLLQRDSELFREDLERNHPDKHFLTTLIKSGTVSDRISALTLLVQESPVHAKESLNVILRLCSKKSRNEATQSVTTLKDLFMNGLLPDRKLHTFKQQPCLGAKDIKDEHLMIWVFEDFLKKFYFEYLQAIEVLTFDPLLFVKSQMVSTMFDLLKAKPEQEQNLLRLLVNKLSDKERKVASKTSYLLLQLQLAHPAMRGIVIREIERFIFAPSTTRNSQYYAVITLNQTILSKKEVGVANHLVRIYFVFFKKLLFGLEKEEEDEEGTEEKEKKVDAGLKRQNKGKNGKKNKPTNDELEKEAQENANSRLISAVLTGVNRAFPFAEVESEEFERHINTLFKITHSATFSTSIRVLMLIFQAYSSRDAVPDRFYRTLYESLLDQRLIDSSKQALYLNLLFKALIVETNVVRVKAFVKRMLQISTWHQPSFVSGLLYLIGELVKTIPEIRTMFTHPELHEFDDDEEENFQDVDDDSTAEEGEKKDETTGTPVEKELSKKAKKSIKHDDAYDGRKREPQFSNADKSCVWEIFPMLNHFHPTVSLYAKTILKGDKIETKPDLSLHTLSHFLDKFAYRKSKKASVNKGQSIMQPLAGVESRGNLFLNQGTTSDTVNTEDFAKKKREDVAVDELFFHRFFTDKLNTSSVVNKRKRESAEDGELDEDAVWKALVDSKPDLELDDEDDGFDSEAMDEAMADLDDEESSAEEQAEQEGEEEEDEEEENEAPMFSDEEKAEDDEGEAEGVEDEEFEGFDEEMDFIDNQSDILSSDAEIEDLPVEEDTTSKKKKKRKTFHDMPVFASAEDYAHLIDHE